MVSTRIAEAKPPHVFAKHPEFLTTISRTIPSSAPGTKAPQICLRHYACANAPLAKHHVQFIIQLLHQVWGDSF